MKKWSPQQCRLRCECCVFVHAKQQTTSSSFFYPTLRTPLLHHVCYHWTGDYPLLPGPFHCRTQLVHHTPAMPAHASQCATSSCACHIAERASRRTQLPARGDPRASVRWADHSCAWRRVAAAAMGSVALSTHGAPSSPDTWSGTRPCRPSRWSPA